MNDNSLKCCLKKELSLQLGSKDSVFLAVNNSTDLAEANSGSHWYALALLKSCLT